MRLRNVLAGLSLAALLAGGLAACGPQVELTEKDARGALTGEGYDSLSPEQKAEIEAAKAKAAAAAANAQRGGPPMGATPPAGDN